MSSPRPSPLYSVAEPLCEESSEINNIQEYVERSVQQYLHSLNGQPPHGLYRLLLAQVEPALFRTVLEYCEGNQTQATRLLGVSRQTLRKKLGAYDLNTPPE